MRSWVFDYFINKVTLGKYIVRQHDGRAVYLRKNNIDSEVYDYVFAEKYHRPYLPLNNNAPVILDLGVNIGLSVVDFKSLYSSAIIYGYELDKNNAAIAMKNTAGLSDVSIYNQGIWYTKKLVSIRGNHADAFTINEESNGDSQVPTTTLNDVIADNKLKNIDYIKMDIEGAEYEVF
jgi:FkbM family methyltransferase